jgi:N-acetylmuramic acid 6-phosphate etherase
MKRATHTGAAPVVLGIECGATRSVALLADLRGAPLGRVEAGPANFRLLTAPQLAKHFRSLAARFPAPNAVGIGMAGVRVEEDRRAVRQAAGRAWAGVPCFAGNDLETALAAAPFPGGKPPPARVVIISGTGSCCYGEAAGGAAAKVGGWGHILGDKGSGYEIGLRALKAVVYYFDRDGQWPALGQRLLRALQLNEPNQLVAWAHGAAKDQIAALAPEVFAAWDQRDRIAADILEGAASSLAKDAVACARRLGAEGMPVEFVLTGGVLLKQPRFSRKLGRELRQRWPRARVQLLEREPAWGAVALARRLLPRGIEAAGSGGGDMRPERAQRAWETGADAEGAVPLPVSTALSPTEERNARSMDLHRRSVRSAIELMLSEEARVPAAVRQEWRGLGRAVRLAGRALKQGGRLFYVGAGTSGRLGVLDASECPPTFGVPPEMVQGVIAGGPPALFSSVEGAEDDAAAGAAAMAGRGVSRRDVVVGIAASGRTPFVWGALRAARRRSAATVLVCFNPHLVFARGTRPDVVICPRIGSEVVTGSTRLKAGTATKLILNILSTVTMVRLGKVMSNLMVDVNPANTKLRERAVRIVRELTGADEATARAALAGNRWVVRAALKELRRGARPV